MPAGTGKTRVILCLIYLLVQESQYKSIIVRFPTAFLKQQDEQAYKNLLTFLPKDARVWLEVGFRHHASSMCTQILDEADFHILDKSDYYDKFGPDWNIIGFTASPVKQKDSVEDHLLKTIGFHIVDSLIQPFTAPVAGPM